MLLENLVTLGLPCAVANDEFVHAMLFGNQPLMDDSQIVQSYALSLTQPITGTNLMVNPRLVLGQTAGQRTAFAGMINQYLDAITAKTHVEAPDYIAETQRAHDLTMRIVQLPTTSRNGQTISFNSLPDKLVNDAPFSVNATALSGLPVSLAALTLTICTVNGNAVMLITTGTCTLQATQPGNGNFNAAPPLVQSFAVKSTEKSERISSISTGARRRAICKIRRRA